MMDLALQRIKTPKALLQGGFFGLVFFGIYLVVDFNNLPYPQMATQYGLWLVGLNLLLNGLMAALSAGMLLLSTANAELKGKESLGSNLSFVSVLFGILTYGCTPCVIAFFSTIGIAFSVAILPFAGLPYKFMSLGLLMIGLIWTIQEVKKGACTVKS